MTMPRPRQNSHKGMLPQPQAEQPLPACRLVEVIPFDRVTASGCHACLQERLRDGSGETADGPLMSAGAASAERRQVTVMFSDLVGSTALSTRMDPEDLRQVISAYQKRVADTVGRFGGFVAKYMGD